MSKREIAIAHFKAGCNCAQAVLLAFCEEVALDETTALRLAAPFGGGFGRQREVCGAVSGMCLVLGFLDGYDDVTDPAKKTAHYATVQQLCAAFRERNGSIICRELLGGTAGKDTAPTPDARTEAYYKKRPCAELVGDAAEILEGWLREHPHRVLATPRT